MLPFFCGFSDVVGLGELCKGSITPQTMAGAVKVLKKYPDIGVMGMQLEDAPTYIKEEQFLRIYEWLDEMVDVVIWDSGSDMDSIVYLELCQKADLQVCVLTADRKGILYFENYRGRILEKDKCIFLEGLAKPYTPYENMSARVGGMFGRLYYGREIERMYLEGNIFSIDQVCHEEYRSVTEKVLEQAFRDKEG